MNAFKGEVPIKLDGKDLVLRFGFNASASFQTVTGQPLRSFFSKFRVLQGKKPDEIGRVILENLGDIELRALLWSALLHQNPNLTLEEAGNLIENAQGENLFTRIAYVFGKLFQTWMLSMGDLKKNTTPEMQEMLQKMDTELERISGNSKEQQSG